MTAKKKAAATWEDLMGKKPRVREVKVNVGGNELTMEFQAMPPKEYDDLLGEHQPSKEQKARGEIFDPEKFPPLLIAACSVSPKISEAQAAEMWTSGNWSKGELMDMLIQVVNLNMSGLDVPFKGSD